MARHRVVLVFLAVLSLLTSPLAAEEPYLEFLEALRKKQYFDTALEYLEWAETRPDLPEDIKVVIPYEKASTLIRLARSQRNPATADATLDRAQAFLEQFLKANPDHRLAAGANSDAAHVLLNKGKVAVILSRSPSNASKRAEYLKQAKGYFDQAGKMFQESATKYSEAYKAYGIFVDKVKEPEKYEAREQVLGLQVRAEIDAGIVQYETAQGYDRDDPQFKNMLKEAADKFELIRQKHRTLRSGLLAKTYLGKCFEEQGELQRALGLYNELLNEPGDDEGLKLLQARVMFFKLVCLNSDKRADYVVADAEAQKWLKENPQLVRTLYGYGIRLEQARALEALSKSRETKDEDRKRLQTEALAAARAANKGGIEFRDASQVLITRLMAALNRDGSEPKDFETAYGMGRELALKIKDAKGAIQGAKDPEEAKKLQRELDLNLSEGSRLLSLALSLRKPDTKLKDLNLARFMLAYVYFEQKKSYDSAVLAEFIARSYADDKDDEMGATPLEAAGLALGAYAQAYYYPGNPDKATDIRRMIELSEFLTQKWPGTSQSVEALAMLGQIYIQTKDFVKAAEMLAKVPEDSGLYLKVQLMLGEALWKATIDGLNKPQAERPPPEKLAELQTKAQQVLQKAIGTLESKLAETEPLTGELANAKLILAEMANLTTKYDEALKLLETDKRSVLSATAVKEGEPRPAVGVKSAAFTQSVYRAILRAYVGLQNLDNAQKAMAELEKLATGQGQDILPIYTALGRQYKEELDRLSKSNQEQYQAVLKSFESFLKNMLGKKDGQTYNSLAWIGAMYVSLGEATADKSAASKYFAEGSTAYTDLIAKKQADSAFCTDQQLLAAKAQLVACKRKAGDFDEAVALLKEVLKQRRNAIDTQTEACHLYQDWADSGQADSPKMWEVALFGDKALPADGKLGMYGWVELATRLIKSPEAAKFTGQFVEARYNMAFCRFRSADSQPANKKAETLGRASTDIQRTAMQVKLDDEQYARFNELFRDIEAAMGKSPSDLQRIQSVPEEKDTDLANGDEATPEKGSSPKKKNASKVAKATKKKAAPVAEAKSESSALIAIVAVLVLAAAGGAFWYVKQSGTKKRPSLMAQTSDNVDFGIGAPPAKAPTGGGSAAPSGAKAKPTSKPKS